MFGYIEDLLLFFLVIYIIKGVLRNFLPFLFRVSNPGKFRNNGNPFGPFSQNTNPNTPPRPEGKIEVDYIPPKKEKKGGHFEGDFIDYEEVKK